MIIIKTFISILYILERKKFSGYCGKAHDVHQFDVVPLGDGQRLRIQETLFVRMQEHRKRTVCVHIVQRRQYFGLYLFMPRRIGQSMNVHGRSNLMPVIQLLSFSLFSRLLYSTDTQQHVHTAGTQILQYIYRVVLHPPRSCRWPTSKLGSLQRCRKLFLDRVKKD